MCVCVCVCVCLFHVFWAVELMNTAIIFHLCVVMTPARSLPLRYGYWLGVTVNVFPPSSFYYWQQNAAAQEGRPTPGRAQTLERNDLWGASSSNLKDWSGGEMGVTWSTTRCCSCIQQEEDSIINKKRRQDCSIWNTDATHAHSIASGVVCIFWFSSDNIHVVKIDLLFP